MPNTDIIVTTSGGAVRGAIRGAVQSWRGIPYAAPPVADRRFRAPAPVEPWEGVRDATDFGAVPPQEPGNTQIGAGKKTPMSEDCLTINVSRRSGETSSLRPVMVWIYGGAYSLGASSSTAYVGSNFVENGDIIFVSFNYRLGALGYLDFTKYSTPARPFDSNLGLRDQVAALEWVRDNIAAFGGDPTNVTIFGESAGANAVTTLMCVPAARGLFARAIAQSSAPTSVYSTERTAAWASAFIGILGGADANAVDLLTSATPEALVAATSKLTSGMPLEQPGTLSLAPVVDGDFLPMHPVDAFRNGSAVAVPLIIGTNNREGAFFQKMMKVLPTSKALIDKMFEITDPGAKQRVLAAYPEYSKQAVATDIAGDIVFWQPCVLVAERHSAFAPTWMYRFDFTTRLLELIGLGATHLTEVGLVFGEPHTGMWGATQLLGGRRGAAIVSKRIHQRWIDFATDGTVGPDWPPYESASRKTLIVAEEERVELDPRGDRRRVWEGYANYR
jgi:para-nitrobenzyl esterase